MLFGEKKPVNFTQCSTSLNRPKCNTGLLLIRIKPCCLSHCLSVLCPSTPRLTKSKFSLTKCTVFNMHKKEFQFVIKTEFIIKWRLTRLILNLHSYIQLSLHDKTYRDYGSKKKVFFIYQLNWYIDFMDYNSRHFLFQEYTYQELWWPPYPSYQWGECDVFLQHNNMPTHFISNTGCRSSRLWRRDQFLSHHKIICRNGWSTGI